MDRRYEAARSCALSEAMKHVAETSGRKEGVFVRELQGVMRGPDCGLKVSLT